MSPEEYAAYSHDCFHALQKKQEALQKDYGLTWLESWYYEQCIALLTLSGEEKAVHFRYASAGTYSRNTKTWKWSWDNEHTMDTVKAGMQQVKEFGEQHRIAELTTGQFDAEEEDGWAFTAVAADLLGGIGAYRPVSDHLLIFLVLLEVVDEEAVATLKETLIDCDAHGTQRAGFACRHLLEKTGAGFHESFTTWPGMELEEDEEFGAWCNDCEEVRAKEGEWNDVSMPFAGIGLVCEDCYFLIKEKNTPG